MDELLRALSGDEVGVPLDRVALAIASIEYPSLEFEPFLHLLDHYADALHARLGEHAEGRRYVTEANQYLFQELGFYGNTENYYDPRNSCLNDVLTARTGIPITLSLVYMEVARRLGRRIRGIGLPGHFVVLYDDGEFSTFIDPFHGGVTLTAAQCFQLADQANGRELGRDRRWLAPMTTRQIVIRMLANLRGIYFIREAWSKAGRVLDLLLAANPDSADEYKQRAAVNLRLNHLRAARTDLERYLALAPEAPDHGEIKEQVHTLRQYLVTLN